MREVDVCGVAIVPDEARVSLSGLANEPGAGHRIFTALAQRNIVVDMIAQTIGSDGLATIGFTVPKTDLESTLAALEPLAAGIAHDDAVSKVSVVGAGNAHPARCGGPRAGHHGGRKNRSPHDHDRRHQNLDSRPARRWFAGDVTRSTPDFACTSRRRSRRRTRRAPPSGRRRPTTPCTRELTARIAAMEEMTVSDVELKTDFGRIAIAGLPNHAANCARHLRGAGARRRRGQRHHPEPCGAGAAELTFSVPSSDLARAAEKSRQVTAAIDPKITTVADDDAAILLLWGVGMRSHAGVARTVFGTLAGQGINVRTSNTSEVCITVVVERRNGELALNALRTAFPAT